MSVTTGLAGYNTLLKRGDGGAGASVKASRSMGSTNSQLKVSWGTAGTIGNNKLAEIIVAGTSTALSVVVTTSKVTVNSATNGGGTATSTVNDIIAALYANQTFQDNWDADGGVGNGTGIIAAATLATLSGGTDGGEVFTTIAEVQSISFDGVKVDFADVTHMESPSRFREYLPTVKDGGMVSVEASYVPSNAGQKALFTDQVNATLRNFQIVLPDSSTWEFSAYVQDFKWTSPFDGKMGLSVGLKVTGAPTPPA